MKMKRIICFMLIVVMIVTTIALPVFAEDEANVDTNNKFYGKNLQFFGDSITYGRIDEYDSQATNNYPKVFSELVGAAKYTNNGVSATTLYDISASGWGRGCIFDKIKDELDQTADYVFVAGGINDWQWGVNEDNLRTGVIRICEYLKSNYSGEVIFITPINHARGESEYSTQTVENVRKVITEVASTYEYTVVQGDKFPFTTAEDDPLFWDKLHPTEEGYKAFAQSLKDELSEDVEDEEPDDAEEESIGIIENIKNSIAQINKTVSNTFASIKLKLQKLFSR